MPLPGGNMGSSLTATLVLFFQVRELFLQREGGGGGLAEQWDVDESMGGCPSLS